LKIYCDSFAHLHAYLIGNRENELKKRFQKDMTR